MASNETSKPREPRCPRAAFMQPSSLPEIKATVDGQNLTRNEARLIGAKERSHIGDVVGSTPAFHQRLLHGALVPCFRSLFAPLGLNPTWSDAIDSYFRRVRLSEAFGHRHDRAFSRRKQFTTGPGHPLPSLIPTDVENGF